MIDWETLTCHCERCQQRKESMPFKSRAQQKYLFANEPEVAKEFAEHTSKEQYKKLPEKVKKKKGKKK